MAEIAHKLKIESVGDVVDGQILIIFLAGQSISQLYALASNLPAEVSAGKVLILYTDGTAGIEG